MRKYMLLIILLGITRIIVATEQQPDKLEYEGLKFEVPAGWGHPSPLQTYFYQNRISYPFQKLSTANYRGHVASWKIKDGKFYLTKIEIEENTYRPEEFRVKSFSDSINTENGVFADWFSGVLHCIQYDDEKDSYKIGSTHYFQIRNGKVIAHEKFKDGDDRGNSALIEMNINYITFYYRLDNDLITLDGKEALLNTDVSRLSPIFDHYGKSILDWPYNWENKEKSGAPNCKWLIEDKRLYLKELTLYSGLMFDSIYTHKLPLDQEFKIKKPVNKVFAKWVNGVYLVVHGEMTRDKSGYEYFKAEQYTFIRVVKGKVKESATVSSEFNLKTPPGNMDKTLKKLFEDYKSLNYGFIE